MPTLHWVGKDKVINHHHDVPFRLLDKKYSFEAKADRPANSSGNRIIHGDNLEALKSLLPEFEGKVNCIYIDPPYNTGNEGWVYNDSVNDPKIKKWLGEVVGKEGEDLSRHDKWLCMMYPRLKLLKRLLTDEGVIFISIDDIEQANLKLLLDEVFGTSKFIGTFIWKSRQNKDNRTKNGASIDHEYVHCYGSRIRGDERDEDQLGLANKDARPNLHYDLVNPHTQENFGCPTQGWRFEKKRMAILIKEGRVLWPSKKDGRPRQKVFLEEMSSEHTGFSSSLNFDLYTYHGTREIEEVFGERVFDFPKSSDFVAKLIEQAACGNEGYFLDSFAGSGTTAHAVMKLNAQDGGNRKFILIETMDYAETITAERVRRVIDGYGEGKKAVAGTGGSFDFYTVGEPLFLEDKNLNESVGSQAIREYVAYTEGVPLVSPTSADSKISPYILGRNGDSVWLFYYDPSKATTLSTEFLAELNIKAANKRPVNFIVYADKCSLDEKFMRKHGITFKRIPRDITKF
jgi:adenine-specific DNA-methyltransferase